MTHVMLDGDNIVVAASGPEATRVGWLLSKELGRRVARAARGRFIVDDIASGTLLELLVDADWDAAALAVAQRYRADKDSQAAARVEVALALGDPRSALAGYPLLTKLDPHQIEAVAAGSVPSLRGLALWDEQGTGKTIMALCTFDRLRQLRKVDRLLVLAPKSVLGSWQKDAASMFGDAYKLLIVHGPTTVRRRLWQTAHEILVCSYDTAIADLGKLQLLVSQKPGRYMLALDESFYLKNPETRRSEAVATVRPYCERALVLCGTPAPNSPRDLLNQINLADGGAVMGGRSAPEDDDEARAFIDEVLQDTIYLRRLKHEVLPDIPTKNFVLVKVKLRTVQDQLYQEARDELALAVRSVDEQAFLRNLGSFLARRAVLLQLCSHPGAIDSLYHEVPAKLLALDKLIEELVDRDGEKVVVWSYYRFSLDQIAKRFAGRGLVRIDGSVTDLAQRIQAVRRFQDDPQVRIFLGNAAAAGAGITLTASRHAIYESFSNQAAHWLQSIDRIHRRGQDREVHCHVLLAEDTIEEREYARLQDKERMARDLLGDVYEEPLTRERFLADLGITA